jgi:hypothetical protein
VSRRIGIIMVYCAVGLTDMVGKPAKSRPLPHKKMALLSKIELKDL